jgi:hypothetical protein
MNKSVGSIGKRDKVPSVDPKGTGVLSSVEEKENPLQKMKIPPFLGLVRKGIAHLLGK